MDLIRTSWSKLAGNGFIPDTLVLGNGASINIHRGFEYKALKDSAGDAVRKIMERAGENDFETLLSRLSTALDVLDMYGVEFDGAIAKITEAQTQVKNGLVAAVTSVCHPPAYAPLASQLRTLATFAAQFNTVLSLNYDLLLYWATYSGSTRASVNFMDCWDSGVFSYNAEKYRRRAGKPVLVFYPHGNLIITTTAGGAEYKVRSAPGMPLVRGISKSLADGHIPLFVSEGDSHKKISRIRSSGYLKYVFDEQIDKKAAGSTCFYGCSFNERDNHIWLPLLRNSNFLVAVIHDIETDQEQLRRACVAAKIGGPVYVTTSDDASMWSSS